jgi:hypothetical protein
MPISVGTMRTRSLWSLIQATIRLAPGAVGIRVASTNTASGISTGTPTRNRTSSSFATASVISGEASVTMRL